MLDDAALELAPQLAVDTRDCGALVRGDLFPGSSGSLQAPAVNLCAALDMHTYMRAQQLARLRRRRVYTSCCCNSMHTTQPIGYVCIVIAATIDRVPHQ